MSSPDGLSGTAPHVEVNFGAFQETQIHVIIPLSFNRPRIGNFTYGPGDIELGVKYRFVNEASSIPQIGVFPLLKIPSGNAEKNLGSGNTQLFLPGWLQKSWGPWTSYGGAGYLVDFASPSSNSWFLGWEGQRDLSRAVTIGAELFSTLVPSARSENELAFSIGAMVNFSEKHHFLISAGRDIAGHSDLLLYAAYQLTIGPD